MKNVTEKAIQEVSTRTGLSHSTVEDLLMKGWTYEEKIDEPPKWLHPMFRVKKQ